MQTVGSTIAVSCFHSSLHSNAQICAGYPWLPESQQKAVVPPAVTRDAVCPVSSTPQNPNTASQAAPESEVRQIHVCLFDLNSVRFWKGFVHSLLAAQTG